MKLNFLSERVFKILWMLLCNGFLIACDESVPKILCNLNFNKNMTGTMVKDSYTYTSYQKEIECATAFQPLHPTSIEELQNIVQYALKNNYQVKALGSLHSITDVICTDGIPVDMKQIKHFSFDSKTNYATAGAGLELQDFLENIHDHGRGLWSSIYGGVTIGGAVGTGAHGTNLQHEATLSDQLVSITFVDGLGNIRKLTEKDEDFKALKVNLGLLGIVYELVFKTTEQYKLKIRNFAVDDDILWKEEEIIKIAESNDHVQFFWFPTNKKVILSVGNRVPVNFTGNCMVHLEPEMSFEIAKVFSDLMEDIQNTDNQVGYFLLQSYIKLGYYKEVPGRTPYFAQGDGTTSCLPLAVGYSHRMNSNRCKECSWSYISQENAGVVFDVSEFNGAMKTLREIMDSILVGFPYGGLLFRFLKESDAYLGLSSGRKSVSLEWGSVNRFNRTEPKLGIAALQSIGQAMVKQHNARPHWSKNGLYYTSAEVIHKVHPNIQKFVEVMNRMDPREVFMNDFGQRLKYGRSDMTLPEDARKRCALNEACLCQKDSDCGDGWMFALICSDFNGYKVCKNRHVFNDAIDIAARDFINSIVNLTDNVTYVNQALFGSYKLFDDAHGA